MSLFIKSRANRIGAMFAQVLWWIQWKFNIKREVDTIEITSIPTSLVPSGTIQVLVDDWIVWSDGLPPWLPGANAIECGDGLKTAAFNKEMLKHEDLWLPVTVHELLHHSLGEDEFEIDRAAYHLLGDRYINALKKLVYLWKDEGDEVMYERLSSLIDLAFQEDRR